MTARCKICAAPATRDAVDGALLEGATYRDIAGRNGVSKSAVERHRAHVPARLARAADAREEVQAGDLLARLRRLHAETLDILAEAREAQNPELALKAISRAEGQLRLEGELLGELQQAPTVNVVMTSEWVALRALILAALASFPEARQAVAEAIRAARG